MHWRIFLILLLFDLFDCFGFANSYTLHFKLLLQKPRNSLRLCLNIFGLDMFNHDKCALWKLSQAQLSEWMFQSADLERREEVSHKKTELIVSYRICIFLWRIFSRSKTTHPRGCSRNSCAVISSWSNMVTRIACGCFKWCTHRGFIS